MPTFLILATFLLLGTQAEAGQWRTFTNDRYGFSVDIPVSYKASESPTNDDGLKFTAPDGLSSIAAYGHLLEADQGLADDERSDEGYDEKDGLRVTYRSVSPTVSTYSGLKGDRIAYQRAVATCKGIAAAIVHAEYPVAQKALYDPIISRIVRPLRGSNRCWTPG